MNITDFTINGECSQCGQCCSDLLPMDKEEIYRIKQYMKRNDIKEQKRIGLNGKIDLSCPFRDEKERKCLIYPVRPEICQQFMCNHTIEDIKKAKFDAHRRKRAVSMRQVFFGSEIDAISIMMKLLKEDE